MSTDLVKATKEATEEQTKAAQALSFVKALEITCDEEYAFAGELLTDAVVKFKAIEEKRTGITKPILAGKRAVDELFKPTLDKLKEIESNLRAKIGAYSLQQERARREAMLESAAEYSVGGTPTAIIPEPPKAQGVSTSVAWDIELVDENLVPREFCSPDFQKIRTSRDWKSYNEAYPPPPIPGVKFTIRHATRVKT
jgi:hypothetical protein